jgi:hypothetical protein
MITNLQDYTSRDCSMFHKGDTMPMRISDEMAAIGWAGGTFVKWVDDGSGQPCLGIADGRYCGFVPFGSNETGDRYTAMTGQNPLYKYVSIYFGGNFMATITYERYTYASRHAGPLVPLVYQAQQFLYVSENGKITLEDESDVAVNAGHTFPDGSPIVTPFLFFGLCAVPPTAASKFYMAVQTNVGV